MAANENKSLAKKQLPRSVVVVAVLTTGVATAWALSKTQLVGPQLSWERASEGVGQVWAGQAAAPPMMPSTPPMAPAATTPAGSTDGGRAVAGLPGVPTILWGSARPHPDRGPCSNCHTIAQREGNVVPAIHSFSMMPHEFRGNCSNCHQITVASGLAGNPVAGTLLTPPASANPGPPGPPQTTPLTPNMLPPELQPMPQAGMQPMQPMPQAGMQPMQPMQPMPQAGMQPMQPMPQAGMQPTPRAMGPNEAEWRGLEVRPAATGVVVTNADGTAARMGLQPGDRVASVNGVQIRTMADFVGATQNGDLPQGTIIVGRDGQRLAFELSRAPANQAPPNGAMGG